MSLNAIKRISLPEHKAKGGFDHAAYLSSHGQIYVAHTANDSIDIIDCGSDTYLSSVECLKGVAGALVSKEQGLVFSSNRGEDTVGIFKAGSHLSPEITKLKVGVRPNGLAFDPERNFLLSANVGNPKEPDTYTLTLLNTQTLAQVASIPVPGRTRWTVFDSKSARFFVNISEPASVITVSSLSPSKIEATFEIPSAGPHGLDFDAATNRLFCACDSGELVILDASTGRVEKKIAISGTPDVIFLNSKLSRLYITVGDPGVVDVLDTQKLTILETVKTEKGAHTIGFDSDRNKVYAFLPASCEALVLQDS
jgi:DNA-binding beta-propeller fold protein YncE